MVKGVTHAHLQPIWHHSEPSNVPYFPNQFIGWDFFAISYSKTALPSCPELRQGMTGSSWSVAPTNITASMFLTFKGDTG